MPLDVKLWLTFGGFWFAMRTADYLWPPSNDVFNAALSLAAMVVLLGRHLDQQRKSG